MTKIIAFAGPKGSGKDSAASVFIEAGWAHVKMAGALKEMLRGLLYYQGVDPDEVDAMLEGDLKEMESHLFSGRSTRHAMQTLGTEWGRMCISPDFWTEIVAKRIALFDRVVISDVRFDNEVDMVRRLGGKVIFIARHRSTILDSHVSEQVSDLSIDELILNSAPTVRAWQAKVAKRFHADLYEPAQ